VTVKINRNAAKSYLRDPKLERELLADGWKIADLAASLAPKDSGSGAASIRAELVKGDVPEVRVSWDRAHFYMGFIELGVLDRPAQPFLRAAAQRFR
jgi:HK97 gp10 family phage protein